MDAFVIVALIGFALLFFELLLPTGGVLAALGVAGVVVAGVLALGSDSDGADYIGPALITLGLLSGVTFYYVTRKVISAHRDQPVRTGTEELVGALAEARSTIDPDGQVWLEGTLWGARLASGGSPARLGDRVRVEAVDGLTLVVSPEPEPAEQEKEGVS
ncbi:MAG TPA: NfeD family protein [Solirubrobacterales bacterium]